MPCDHSSILHNLLLPAFCLFYKKVGGNYAPSIAPAVSAAEKGCAQVLWLYPEGDDYLVTEVRFANFLLQRLRLFFFYVRDSDAHHIFCTSPPSVVLFIKGWSSDAHTKPPRLNAQPLLCATATSLFNASSSSLRARWAP